MAEREKMKKITEIKRKIARKAGITVIKAILAGADNVNLHGLLAGSDAVSICYKKLLEVVKEKKWEYPLTWLLHYLEGSGEALYVPNHIVEDASSAIVEAVEGDLDYEFNSTSMFDGSGTYYVNHSLMYEGHGFLDRPVLFYLVGGFTFRILEGGVIYAEDEYDWHPNQYGEFFNSPIGCQFEEVFKLLISIFGNEEWFILEDDWTGDGDYMCSVSNKLFYDMESVGAKPFTTIICCESEKIKSMLLESSKEEFEEVENDFKEFKDFLYYEDIENWDNMILKYKKEAIEDAISNRWHAEQCNNDYDDDEYYDDYEYEESF